MFFFKILAILFIILIPGFLGFILLFKYNPVKSRDLFITLLFNISISSIAGILLAELQIFSLVNLFILLLTISLILLFVCIKNLRQIQLFKISAYLKEIRNNPINYLIPAIIVFLSIIVLFPGYPWVWGGRDPGVYINTGVNIAKTGQIKVYDEEVANMTGKEVGSFLHYESRPDWVRHNGYMYVGFYLTDAERGEVTPQFFTLYSIWIAILYSIGGITTAINTASIFGVLGILATYFFAREIKNSKFASFVALLSLISFTQIWWSKYPNAEIVTQVFFWGGLLLFHRAIKEKNHLLGLYAGLVFAIQYLVTIQALFLIPPLVLFVLFAYVDNHKAIQGFIIGNLSIFLFAIAHAYLFSGPYFNGRWGEIFKSKLPNEAVLIGGILLVGTSLCALAEIVRTHWGKLVKRFTQKKYITTFFTTIIIGTILIGIYRIPNSDFSSDGYNLIKLSAYIGWASIISLFFGLFFIVKNKNTQWVEIIITATTTVILATMLFRASISRDHPWWSRRFFPIILGAVPYITAVFLEKLIKGKNRTRRLVMLGFGVILILTTLFPSLSLYKYTEHPDSIRNLSQIHDQIKSNSIILFGQKSSERDDFLIGYFAAQPLRFIYNHKTYILNDSTTNFPVIKSKIKEWISEGKSVYITGTDFDLERSLISEFELERIIDYDLDFQQRGWRSVFYPEEVSTDNKLTSQITNFTLSDTLYEILPKSKDKKPPEEMIFDIGGNNEGLIGLSGVYQKETTEGRSFRWTEPEFTISLLYQLEKEDVLSIKFSLLQEAEHRQVTITAENCGSVYEFAGISTLQDFTTIEISGIDSCEKEGTQIAFSVSPTEVPQNDQRELGIAIDMIKSK